MTTIAYRDGVLAADGRVTMNGLIVTDECRKITRLSDGSLFALCGDDVLEPRIIKWLEDCEEGPPPQGKDFTAILVEVDGSLHVFNGVGDFNLQPYPDFAAFGSGLELAYGAMEVGATAEEAVVAAARRDSRTGGAIQTERPGMIEVEETNDQPTE